MYGLLGKPVASSTPIKELFDTNKEHFSKVKKKKIQEKNPRNNKFPLADGVKSASLPTCNVYLTQLEIVSSESDLDSDIIPYKKVKVFSPKVNQFLATSSKMEVGKRKQLGNLSVKRSKKVQYTDVLSSSEGDEEMIRAASKRIEIKKTKKTKRVERSSENSDKSVHVVNHGDQERVRCKKLTKKLGQRLDNSKLIQTSAKTTDSHPTTSKKDITLQNITKNTGTNTKFATSSEVIVDTSAVNGPIINPPNDYESSSGNSGRDVEDCDEYESIKGRKPLAKRTNLIQKKKKVTASPQKLITKELTVNLSSQNVSKGRSKKITTPMTGMPAARQRLSLCRTLSRISASASNKFMVEIPKNLADSFSASLQLIKRRIDFEKVEEPKKQRIIVGEAVVLRNEGIAFENDESKKQENLERENYKKKKKQGKPLKSPQETVARKCTTLKPIYSSEKDTTEKEANAALKGVRRSSRYRIPPISYWLGNESQEGHQLFTQNKIKTRRSSHTSLLSHPTKANNNLKKHSSLRASTTNDITEQTKKTDKTVRWKNVSRNKLNEPDIGNKMKVCFSQFDQSVFLPADDEGDRKESGVQFATSLHTFDMQSEFIRLLSGAETADLFSNNYNQLYTVLENTVSFCAEGALKEFGLHSQFYVHKGVSHRLQNNSNEASLLLQIIIQK